MAARCRILLLLATLAVLAGPTITAAASRDACLQTAPRYDVSKCERAFGADPKDAEVALALYEALQGTRKYRRAVEVLKTALEHHPDNTRIADRLAIARSNLDEQEWLANRRRAADGKGKASAAVSLRIASVRCTSLKGEEALGACEQVLSARPDDALAHAALGDALLSLGRIDGAAESYRQAARLRPGDAVIATKLASLTKSEPKKPGVEEQLAVLQRLRKDRLITEAEFNKRQRALLDKAFGTATADARATAKDAEPKQTEVAIPDLDYGAYHALVIGNDAYRHLPKLKTAGNDAKAVAALLERSYGFAVTLLRNATRADILHQMNRLRSELTESDNLLIYYAGHGTLDRQSDTGYWLPVDADLDNDVNWIANATLTRHLRAMFARHVLVIADSCFSGTLFRAADTELSMPKARDAWLRKMLEKRSRTAITSGGLEPVVDSGRNGHSVFANALQQALEENTGVLEDQALFRLISRPVALEANQTPRVADIRQAGHEGGAFLFVRRR